MGQRVHSMAGLVQLKQRVGEPARFAVSARYFASALLCWAAATVALTRAVPDLARGAGLAGRSAALRCRRRVPRRRHTRQPPGHRLRRLRHPGRLRPHGRVRRRQDPYDYAAGASSIRQREVIRHCPPGEVAASTAQIRANCCRAGVHSTTARAVLTSSRCYASIELHHRRMARQTSNRLQVERAWVALRQIPRI